MGGGGERPGCIILTVYLVSCDSQCSVALPRVGVGQCVIVEFPDHTQVPFYFYKALIMNLSLYHSDSAI